MAIELTTASPQTLSAIRQVLGVPWLSGATFEGDLGIGANFRFQNVTETRSGVTSNSLWLLANAYYDETDGFFYRIDTSKFSFGLQIQASGTIPGEEAIDSVNQGYIIWKANPTNTELGKKIGCDSSGTFYGTYANYYGWNLGFLFTAYSHMVIGGQGIEIDGAGTMPFARVLLSPDFIPGRTTPREIFAGFVQNFYADFSGRDQANKESWFYGVRSQNLDENTNQADNGRFSITYLSANQPLTAIAEPFSVSKSGDVTIAGYLSASGSTVDFRPGDNASILEYEASTNTWKAASPALKIHTISPSETISFTTSATSSYYISRNSSTRTISLPTTAQAVSDGFVESSWILIQTLLGSLKLSAANLQEVEDSYGNSYASLDGYNFSTLHIALNDTKWVITGESYAREDYHPKYQTFNNQAASYTFGIDDVGRTVRYQGTNSITWLVPPNINTSIPIGAVINVYQENTGAVTLSASLGVTLLSRGGVYKTAGQYALVSLLKTYEDTWAVTGDLVP